MNPVLVGISTFLGIALGLGGAFLLISRQKKKERKNVLDKIEKQNLKFRNDGIPVDIYGKQIGKAPAIEKREDIKKVEKKKPKRKVRAKKTKAKQKGKGKK